MYQAMDTVRNAPRRLVRDGSFDATTGVRRSTYRIPPVRPASDPVAGALSFLRARSADYGISDDLTDLDLVESRSTGSSRHVVFQQTWQGIPVHDRFVRVSLDKHNRPTMVMSGYEPIDGRQLRLAPVVTAREASAIAASRVVEERVITGKPRLVVLPGKHEALAWIITAWPASGGELEVAIDAVSGRLLQVRGLGVREERNIRRDASAAFPSDSGIQQLIHKAPLALAAGVPGSGMVFDPDPLTTAGVGYGGAYQDAGDTPSPALDLQRKTVVLPDLTQGVDGLFRLEGPNVRVVSVNSGGIETYSPPAEADPNGFRYGRDHDAFEAVMVYYHVDKSQRYADSLVYGLSGQSVQRDPIRVNPHGRGPVDDSWFYPSRYMIEFGTGGIDDAEDGSVIWHEHAHAILEVASRGLRATGEGIAYHEGWADYWAASYIRGLIETGKVPYRDWRRLFF